MNLYIAEVSETDFGNTYHWATVAKDHDEATDVFNQRAEKHTHKDHSVKVLSVHNLAQPNEVVTIDDEDGWGMVEITRDDATIYRARPNPG